MPIRLLAPGYQQFDANGDPVSGARLNTYAAGTTTPKATFSDGGLTIANANPVVANAAGVFGPVFAGPGSYALEMTTSTGAVLWTADPVDGNADVPQLSTLDNVEPMLFNSTFSIWQRGTTVAIPASSTTVAAVYAADGWAMNTGASQNCTVSQQAGISDGARYSMRVQRDSGQTGTGILFMQQWIPTTMLAQLRGRQATFSVDVRVGTTFSGTLQLVMFYGTGTEGRRPGAGYTGDTAAINSGFLAVTTTTQRFSATSGAVIPATATQAMVALRWIPSGTAGANDYFEIGRPVLAPNPGIEPPIVSEMYELQRAQRWYVTPRSHFRGRNETAATPVYATPVYFPVTMRAAPTVTVGTVVSSTGISARNAANITASSFTAEATANAGPIAITDVIDWVADARL